MNRVAARRAHDALLSALRDLDRAEKNAVLCFADVMHQQHFRPLGYSSIWHYATEGLGFSSSKTAQFVRLAKDVKRLPALKQAIERGEVPWTKAREISKVATPDNQNEWIAVAKKKTRRELEKSVKQARARAKAPEAPQLLDEESIPKGDPPMRVSFDLTPLQYAQLQKQMERIQRKRTTNRAELLLEAFAALTSENCTRVQLAPAEIVAYRCDDCERTLVPTNNGMKAVSPTESAVLECDSTPVAGSKAMPPKLRNQVLIRDRHRCRRCRSTNFLDAHHVTPRSRGGDHSLRNCVTLCRACHVNVHQGSTVVPAPT